MGIVYLFPSLRDPHGKKGYVSDPALMSEHFYDAQKGTGFLSWRLKSIQRGTRLSATLEDSRAEENGGPMLRREPRHRDDQPDEQRCQEIISLMNHTNDREVIMKKMRDTLEYRERLIHDPDRSSTVLSVFPRLLDTKGLILQDFRLLFGSETSSKLLEKWPNSFKANVIEQAEMLTPTPLLRRLLLCAKNQQGAALELPGTSKEAISSFFIAIDKKLIPCEATTSLAAIDELFKVHFVLGIRYDPALKSMYTFLQTTVYNIDVDTTSESPKIKELRTKLVNNV
ncbi:hypothetical protein SKAU_G00248450 [Synaphobranchus kaupii]|uniref:Uncharacterized protein n=1 Tax=Synaphobranchus kaupii TaxID=118154 RepID=A0A9Q1IRM2_SYNKA|nr:hypothetical protein SKAU_G00248450 [Synaphobranchus kaupii]